MISRGAITLVFDDGYTTVFRTVVPLLNNLGIPGVFAVPLDVTNLEKSSHEPLTAYQEWLTIRSHGHEIAAHSATHLDLVSLPPASREHELRLPAEKLQTQTLVYPGGAFNDQVAAAASLYYQAARTLEVGLNSMRPTDPMRLKTYNYTRNNFSLIRANLLAFNAYLTNRWLIETFHLVDNDTSRMVHTITLKAFKAHLNFITHLPTRIQTINDIIDHG